MMTNRSWIIPFVPDIFPHLIYRLLEMSEIITLHHLRMTLPYSALSQSPSAKQLIRAIHTSVLPDNIQNVSRMHLPKPSLCVLTKTIKHHYSKNYIGFYFRARLIKNCLCSHSNAYMGWLFSISTKSTFTVVEWLPIRKCDRPLTLKFGSKTHLFAKYYMMWLKRCCYS